jgi:hypothetical protein
MHTVTREVKRLLYEKKLRERFAAVRDAQGVDEVFGALKKDPISWSLRNDDPGGPEEPPDPASSHAHWDKRAREAGVDQPILGQKGYKAPPSPPSPQSQDPTRAARPKAKKKTTGFAEGEQPEQRINLAEAEENPLIGAIEGIVKSNPLAFGLEEAPEPAIIRAMIEPMVAAAMQAGMAAVASSQDTRGDNSGPALVKNPLTET